MQKVYLLLRNNQQTGPYNLEELLQFDLKPYDLIWIEGRSAGWYYPQEIPALQPHLPFLKGTSLSAGPAPTEESIKRPAQTDGPKKIFVSMPSNVKKEEPTPKPSFAPLFNYENETPKSHEETQVRQPEDLRTTYAKSLEEVENDYMNWAYQKKSKKKPFVSTKGILIACLIVGVAFAGWIMLQPSDEDQGKTAPEQTAFLTAQNELPADTVTEESNLPINTKNKKQKLVKKAGNITEQKSTTGKQTNPGRHHDEVAAVSEPPQNEYEATPEIKDESKPVVQEKKSEPVAAESPKEKKKLRDKIADLFKKKPEEKKEEAKPVEEENGERRSVRRETGSNLAQMVTVKFAIPNDWMMGIKGAKATLTNRSSEAIAKAVVEVVYYNDDNDVLDKRNISFGNIKSKQTQTISIPDHQTATRLEYNVVSVTGANEPFAMM
ncbi:MAG TPA: hypothetical protein VGB71_06505 [Flavisolibacter sp.]